MKILAKKRTAVCLLALSATLVLFAGCNHGASGDDEDKAASIRTSEEFSDGTTFEYTGGNIELPYGIAVNADGEDISLDVTYVILDGEGEQIQETTEPVFALSVGSYTIRYVYQDVSMEVDFSVVDTIAPQIQFTTTNTGGMELTSAGGAVSVSLPQYAITDYSNCTVDESLVFVSDDGTYDGKEEYPYDNMSGQVTASQTGTFTYTVTATDASGNSASASVQWRCKDPANWTANDADSLKGTNVLSSFDDADYVDSVLIGDMYDRYTTYGDFFVEWVDEYAGAEGVVKISSQFNSQGSIGGYAEFRFKLGQEFNLGEYEGKNKFVVVRMYIPEDSGVGTTWMQFGGNTRSNHNYSGFIENHTQTRDYNKITQYSGMTKGKWFELYIPVDDLIAMEAADGIEFKDPGMSDDEYFLGNPTHTSYEYADRNQLRGAMKYLQFAIHKGGGDGYQDFYIDSITLADRCEGADPDSFSVDFDEMTISWDAVTGAEYYNVFADGTLRASVTEPEVDGNLLGGFATLTVVTIGDGMADSLPVSKTSAELEILQNSDGSWTYRPRITVLNTALDGDKLILTVNQNFGEGGALDMSGVTATDLNGEPIVLQASASGDKLIFDVSDWPKPAGVGNQFVTIAAGSTFTVDGVTYTFATELLLIADSYEAIGVTGVSVSEDGNALTVSVGVSVETAAVTEAEITAVYDDNTSVAISAEDISYSTGALVFDITDWNKSSGSHRVSVTIKSGSSVTIGEDRYVFDKDVTFTNLILPCGTNTAQSWVIVDSVSEIYTVEMNGTSNTLGFWIRDAAGNNINTLGLQNSGSGSYYKSYRSDRQSLDYSGSIKLNGVELAEANEILGNIALYELRLSYANAGRLMIQIISRNDASQESDGRFSELCAATDKEMVTFEIAAGTTLYWKVDGKIYAFVFVNAQTFTKDLNGSPWDLAVKEETLMFAWGEIRKYGMTFFGGETVQSV